MSESQVVESRQKNNHGTTKTYMIGFLLSLILTAVPYYMVVNQSFSGTLLLTTILGFALLQMATQIFFFLHLGRGPKPFYNIVFFIHSFGIILVVVLGSIFIMNNLHYNMTPTEVTKKLSQSEGIAQIGGENTGACQEVHTNHKVIIKNGKVSPVDTTARLCDSISFINEDDSAREIAFGPHPTHDSYAGQEVFVRKGRPKSITLNQPGRYLFHDHLDPEVVGYFTVLR